MQRYQDRSNKFITTVQNVPKHVVQDTTNLMFRRRNTALLRSITSKKGDPDSHPHGYLIHVSLVPGLVLKITKHITL